VEFSRAWDQYMQEYEAAASLSVVRMREKHQYEVEELR
jgi:hypothetical protein